MEETDSFNYANSAAQLVAYEFTRSFQGRCRVFRAPGRVNLIGEHTDYNDGFVMPAALGFYTYAAVGTCSDRRLSVYSLDFDETAELKIDALVPGPTGHWSDYVRGVAAVLRAHGVDIRGANLVIKGEVPMGAGLSSSAAIEVSTAFALLAAAEAHLDRREIASVCQRAEHEYAGTQCGIMDQFISCFGQANHALLLDCRTLAYETLPIPDAARIVICNSMVKHELAGGEYNRRRADCEAGVQLLQSNLPNVRALRDVDLRQLNQYSAEMPERIYRRCRHVVSEIARTLEAAAALKSGDLGLFGRLMYASHDSLRDDYEVSCHELDLLVELASKCSGVFGARMTGGGFGGCTVNLVAAEAVESFSSGIAQQYREATGKKPEIYVGTASDGAEEVGAQPA
jgi:galactokinase